MNKGIKRKFDGNMQDTKEHTINNKEDTNLFCEICKIQLPNEPSMRQHLLGQKHRKQYTPEKEREVVEKKCGIFVRGFSPDFPQDVIINYFSRYGKIIWIHLGYSFLLLDYADPSAAEEVMKRNHILGGKHLLIKYRHLKQEVQVNKPEQEDSKDFIDSLKDITKLDDQVQILIQNLQPQTENPFPKYSQICEDLYITLAPVFPYCQIHPFGSTVTGLNFNNSDIDVFISGIKNDEDDVPYLYKTKNLLLKSKKFRNLIVIPHAKIPILKCLHIRTGISCDINLKNMLGVCNSQLTKYFLNISLKVRCLMMVIKYWAKVHKISGQNNLFSNYSLTMMVIFFLQQDPFNIPSVMSLQKHPYFFNYQDGWNGGFQPFLVQCLQLDNTSLLKLLKNFFVFYSGFDYGVNVICPYMGRPMRKEGFINPDMLPDNFFIYKQYIQFGAPLKVNTCICIQDPFEHSRNTTPIVSASTLNVFVSFCRLGKKLCEGDEKGLLYKLLTEVPQILKSEILVKPEFSQFSIPMQPSLKYIEKKTSLISERHNIWFNHVLKFITIILKDVLKLEVTELNSPLSENKNRRNEGQSDVYEQKEINKITYKCTGKLNLWHGRKTTAKINTSEKNQVTIIEKETAVTNQLYNLYKDCSQNDDIINCEITLEHNLDPPCVIVKIKKKSAYKNSFKPFALFLSASLPSWFKVYEYEQNCSQD